MWYIDLFFYPSLSCMWEAVGFVQRLLFCPFSCSAHKNTLTVPSPYDWYTHSVIYQTSHSLKECLTFFKVANTWWWIFILQATRGHTQYKSRDCYHGNLPNVITVCYHKYHGSKRMYVMLWQCGYSFYERAEIVLFLLYLWSLVLFDQFIVKLV